MKYESTFAPQTPELWQSSGQDLPPCKDSRFGQHLPSLTASPGIGVHGDENSCPRPITGEQDRMFCVAARTHSSGSFDCWLRSIR